jgi:hypothetical protein
VRGLCFRPRPRVGSWDELNALIRSELERNLDRRKLPHGRTVRQALIPECEHLQPLPAHLPEACRVVACVADKFAMVHVDRCGYSVSPQEARCALLVSSRNATIA